MKSFFILLIGLVQFSSCVYYLHRYSDSYCGTQREFIEIIRNQSQCWQNTSNAFYGTRAERFEISFPTTTNDFFVNLRYCNDKSFGDACCGDTTSLISIPFNVCTSFSDFSFLIDEVYIENNTNGGILPLAIAFDILFSIITLILVILAKVRIWDNGAVYIVARPVTAAFLLAAVIVNGYRTYNTQYHVSMEFCTLVLLRISFAFEFKQFSSLNARWIVKLVLAFFIYVNYVIFFIYIPEDVLFYVYFFMIKQALFLNVSMQIMENNGENAIIDTFKLEIPTRFARMHMLGDFLLACYTLFVFIYHIYSDVITFGMSLSNNAMVVQIITFYIVFVAIVEDKAKDARAPVYFVNLGTITCLVFGLVFIFEYVSDYGKIVAVVAAVLALLWSLIYVIMLEAWVRIPSLKARIKHLQDGLEAQGVDINNNNNNNNINSNNNNNNNDGNINAVNNKNEKKDEAKQPEKASEEKLEETGKIEKEEVIKTPISADEIKSNSE